MLRLLLVILLFVHGFVHLIGFARAFSDKAGQPFTTTIGPAQGIAWLVACILFTAAALLLLSTDLPWWLPAAAALLLSQVLVIGTWADARWGTIANVIIGLVVIGSFGAWRFRQSWKRDVQNGFVQLSRQSPQLIGEADIAPMPLAVQRYLRYTGVVGRPRIQSAHIVFEGRMRKRNENWFPFRSDQYNFFENYRRLFFMKGRLMGVTVPGYHSYQDGAAGMDIRLGGLLPLVQISGSDLFRAESVTLLNDICLLAPAALVDPRITWKAVDDRSAWVYLQNGKTKVSAQLFFNDNDELVDFVSDDRYDVNAGARYRFSTPVRNYRDYGGYKLPSYGEAIWHYPEGRFTYGIFELREVRYNLKPGR